MIKFKVGAARFRVQTLMCAVAWEKSSSNGRTPASTAKSKLGSKQSSQTIYRCGNQRGCQRFQCWRDMQGFGGTDDVSDHSEKKACRGLSRVRRAPEQSREKGLRTGSILSSSRVNYFFAKKSKRLSKQPIDVCVSWRHDTSIYPVKVDRVCAKM